MTPHDPVSKIAAAIPPDIQELCQRFQDAGHQAWVVGGAVRDVLLGRPHGDWDLASSARPEQVQACFRNVIPTGVEHGTVTVLWKGEPVEVTTFRGERGHTDGRRPDEVFFCDNITDDLSRRDFTVNALAFDPLSKQLEDPFDGQGDLQRQQIRAVREPLERFLEDGLRSMRAVRFSATLQFAIEPRTLSAIPKALEVFQKVARERVRDEFLKTLTAPKPSTALDVLRTTGMLAHICPELLQSVGCAQNSHHAHDVWNHMLHCLDVAEPTPVQRLTALLHDVAKPVTRERSDKTGDYSFYGHEKVGAGTARRWMRAYRFPNDLTDEVTHLVRHHLVAYQSLWTDAAVRRWMHRVGTEHTHALLEFARADTRAKGVPVQEDLALLDELQSRVQRELDSGTAFTLKQLAINGRDLMAELGWPPGRHIGEALQSLLEHVLDHPGDNERATLLDLANRQRNSP